ncbi:MAG: hypothetical protein ABIR62_02795 [Dokdonella sp.]|uniref:hypothetical protein n=1 Tax=Dokdonella sp. TaxID=2291710 RepID=UPI003267D238
MFTKVRFAAFGVLVAASFALAPAAFARSHWNVGVSIGLPGIGIGYSDYGRHGRGWGGNYYGGASYGYGGGYYGGVYAPAPVYYSPSYYAPAYYAPAYYNGGGYYGGTSVRYSDRPSHRYYDRHESRGRDGGHRASYYDRSGYRH